MNYFRLSFLSLVLFLVLTITTAASTDVTSGSATEYESRVKKTEIAGYCWDMFRNVGGSVAGGYGVYKSVTRMTNQDLADELLEVQLQLEDIKRSITELINQVEEESIRTQYVSSERVIVESLRCENNYGNMTEAQDADYWRREFLKWGSMLRESVTFLMDGMLGKGMIGSDILDTIAKIVNSNGGNKTAAFQSATDQLYGLINSGFVVHASFVGLNNISDIANAPVVELFDASYYNMSKRINDTMKTCDNNCTLPPSIYRATKRDHGQIIRGTELKSTRVKRQSVVAAIKVFGYISDMFSAVNSGIKGYHYFTEPKRSELMNQIKSIEDQLDQVQAGLDQLMAEIADGSMRTQYVSSQRVIMESLRIASNYVNVSNEVNATSDDLDYWASEMGKWGSLVRESVMFLMDGFLGTNVIAGDLLKYLVLAEQHDATAIERRFNDTMALVNVGLYVHALFVNFTGISEAANAPVVAEFETSYTSIGLRLEQTVNNQEDRSAILSKMEEVLWSSSSPDEKADSIYSYLTTEAAPDRNWYLVVFYFSGDLDGDVGATQYFDSDFYWVGPIGPNNKNKMSAAAISIPTKMNTQLSMDSATSSAVNNFDCWKKRYQQARTPTDDMHGSLSSACPTCRIGTLVESYEIIDECPSESCSGRSSTFAYSRIGYLLTKAMAVKSECGMLWYDFRDKYAPYKLSILPGTRKFTVPEEE